MNKRLSILLLFFVFISCIWNDHSESNPINDEEVLKTKIRERIEKKKGIIGKLKLIDSTLAWAEKEQYVTLYLEALSLKIFYLDGIAEDSIYPLLKRLEKKATKEKIKPIQAYSYSLLGKFFFNNTSFDSAYYYLKRSNELYDDRKDSLYIGYNLIYLSRIHNYLNDYSGSQELATEALSYLEPLKKVDYIVEANNIIAISLQNTFNYEEAVKIYEKLIRMSAENKIAIFGLKNNIAAVFIQSKEFEKAYRLLIDLKNVDVPNANIKAGILSNLGYTKFKMHPSSGISELNESLTISKSIDQPNTTIEIHRRIAEYYEHKNPCSSKEHIHKALVLSKKYKFIDEELLSLKFLIGISEPFMSKYYSEEYIRLNDSITNLRMVAKNEFAKIRYDYSKEQEQNLLLKSKSIANGLIIEKQRNTNQLLVFLFVIGSVMIVFVYYLMKNKHKRRTIEERYRAEHQIATRIHDELANDIYRTMIYTENTDLSKLDNRHRLLDNLEDVYHRTRNISKENSTIEVEERFGMKLKMMFLEYQNEQLKILIASAENVNWEKVASFKKVIIYRVLQEIMVNMKKHSNAKLVIIRFETIKKKIKITYSDNGIGMIKENIIQKGGLKNVENRISAIQGSAIFESNKPKGLRIIIIFPK